MAETVVLTELVDTGPTYRFQRSETARGTVVVKDGDQELAGAAAVGVEADAEVVG